MQIIMLFADFCFFHFFVILGQKMKNFEKFEKHLISLLTYPRMLKQHSDTVWALLGENRSHWDVWPIPIRRENTPFCSEKVIFSELLSPSIFDFLAYIDSKFHVDSKKQRIRYAFWGPRARKPGKPFFRKKQFPEKPT